MSDPILTDRQETLKLTRRSVLIEAELRVWITPAAYLSIHDLFTRDGDYDFSISWFDVAFQVKDLLPGTENGAGVADGDRDRWAQPSGLQVRVAIAIVPGLFMAVGWARRNQLIKNLRKIPFETGFEFDRSDGPCAADVKDVNRA